MKVPGFVVTALLVGAVAFLQTLSTGLEGLRETWWAPALVALVASGLKVLEAWRDVERDIDRRLVGLGSQRSVGPDAIRAMGPMRGFWDRFFLG